CAGTGAPPGAASAGSRRLWLLAVATLAARGLLPARATSRRRCAACRQAGARSGCCVTSRAGASRRSRPGCRSASRRGGRARAGPCASSARRRGSSPGERWRRATTERRRTGLTESTVRREPPPRLVGAVHHDLRPVRPYLPPTLRALLLLPLG